MYGKPPCHSQIIFVTSCSNLQLAKPFQKEFSLKEKVLLPDNNYGGCVLFGYFFSSIYLSSFSVSGKRLDIDRATVSNSR